LHARLSAAFWSTHRVDFHDKTFSLANPVPQRRGSARICTEAFPTFGGEASIIVNPFDSIV
ncbi:hypothetical protein COJ85_26360, partial [Bacillus sp. AFS076308]